MSHVEFKEMTMSDVSVAYFSPCHMSNLKNGHVALSNLGVNTHSVGGGGGLVFHVEVLIMLRPLISVHFRRLSYQTSILKYVVCPTSVFMVLLKLVIHSVCVVHICLISERARSVWSHFIFQGSTPIPLACVLHSSSPTSPDNV